MVIGTLTLSVLSDTSGLTKIGLTASVALLLKNIYSCKKVLGLRTTPTGLSLRREEYFLFLSQDYDE